MRDCEPRNFVRPCLLLLLGERPDHGYGLIERLRELCGADNDASGIYRALRNLERDGLVCSAWRTATPGPARRCYELTALGESVLADCAEGLRATRAAIDAFLGRYARDRAMARTAAQAPATPIYRI
ncbi:helix-turn-helix transcriptional regulator [Kutzneria viridogrisea]|uniref:Transcription regulator PadR N-terminal domain-containing protein n=2 Tax=Kutzneria TaxID=43356 RepID=W5W3L6_9PSEU|nr:PadR family transcriptional regulator [Kutzneria albida]AHH95432.1 hypothetical protein KALB_2063 [Kutzneria albida DSM 43870]MBA8927209.1 poly-beta-hydroxybutyrate-responsive repressor [Kutzneria viridogrisea]